MFTKTLLILAGLLTGQANDAQTQAPARAAQVQAASAGDKATATKSSKLSDPAQVVARVQEFYIDTQRLTALFRQIYTNTTFGKKSVSDGKLWVKKPGKMRWDYRGSQKKVKKSFISDGTTLWAVEHDNQQVFKKNLEDDMLPVAVSFLYGKGDLARDFRPALDTSNKYGKKSDYVLELTPRKPSAQYKTLYLVVDPGNFRVKESVVIEASGNTNHFRFFSPDTRAGIQDAWFFFNEKRFKNYRMVEPDAPKSGTARAR
ncbi:LolA family protein [Haliangium ochraceum]|uniref:Outer membrane lipoprotein carrier protein LolA n=1 Tax=Haliangium ochraceum (strain DSM 14365 / JCM 11303 / SMP-2) TaxID=502025 RepID=D0LUK4_HALO1|nr:outer membrane lipoprotein carrier protein LolA [Haliangium ochraceum]ACY19327.1 outer membrane lipoprotein carrier protein LolA [Haliangium ochraceum DSM 14365]